jgi:hypothetical protein
MLSVEYKNKNCKYKIVKSANSPLKTGSIHKKNVKISSWWSGRSSKFCVLLVHQRRGDRAVGSGGFLSYASYCLSLLRGWCVVYGGDASAQLYPVHATWPTFIVPIDFITVIIIYKFLKARIHHALLQTILVLAFVTRLVFQWRLLQRTNRASGVENNAQGRPC